jgi:hypothetical protein
MVVDLAHPDLLPRLGVDGVRVRATVTEIHGVPRRTRPARVRSDGSGRTHAGLRAKRPVGASGFPVQRVHRAGLTRDEQTAARDGWLGSRGQHAGEPECPFQLQLRHVRGRQPSPGHRLKAGIRHTRAPAVPRRSDRRVGHRRGRDALTESGRRRCAHGTTRQELRHVPALGVGQLLSLNSHAAAGQRVDDRVGHECGERGRVRSTRIDGGIHMTRGARPLEHARASRRLREPRRLPEDRPCHGKEEAGNLDDG